MILESPFPTKTIPKSAQPLLHRIDCCWLTIPVSRRCTKFRIVFDLWFSTTGSHCGYSSISKSESYHLATFTSGKYLETVRIIVLEAWKVTINNEFKTKPMTWCCVIQLEDHVKFSFALFSSLWSWTHNRQMTALPSTSNLVAVQCY